MTVWEQSTYWNSLVADLGAYKGPWPVPVPLMQNLPLDAHEIDYIVALPNPDGHAGDVADGSYSTMSSQSWINWTISPPGTSFNTNSSTTSTGGAADAGTMPVGAHLFVLWYDLARSDPSLVDPPSLDALQLVPPDWVLGGAGWSSSPTDGKWSRWITGSIASHPAKLRRVGYQSAILHSNPSFTGMGGQPASYRAVTDGQVATIRGLATPPYAGEALIGAGAGYSIDATGEWIYDTADPTQDMNTFDNSINAQQGVATYSGAGYETDVGPSDFSPLDGLVEGVDYGPNPTTGVEIDYESDAATVIGWDNWTVEVHDFGSTHEADWNSYASGLLTSHTSVTTPISTAFEYRLLPAPNLPTSSLIALDDPHEINYSDDTSPWVGPGAGTLLATYTTSTSASFATPIQTQVVLPLAGVGTADTFTVACQPDLLHAADAPYADFSLPAYASTPSFSREVKGIRVNTFIYNKNLDNYAYNFLDTSQRATVPQVRYQEPRWRYWIPAFIPPPAGTGPFWPGFKLDSGFKGSAVNFSGSGF